MFPYLLFIQVEITGSVIGLKICAITAGIKNYKSTIKNKEMKHDKIALLAKSKLNGIKVLISKVLIYLDVSHDEFVF